MKKHIGLEMDAKEYKELYDLYKQSRIRSMSAYIRVVLRKHIADNKNGENREIAFTSESNRNAICR